MINRIVTWIKTPYYFNPSMKYKLKISLYHGLFIFLFLYIFKPFYLAEIDEILFEYTLGFGFVAFMGTFFILYIPSLIFKNYFREDNWTLGKNIILILVGVTLIAFLLWYFGEAYKEINHFNRIPFLEFLFYTLLVSIFPLTSFIFLNEREIRTKRELRANIIKLKNNDNLKRESLLETNKIEIFSENQKESIKFYLNDLVYITSQGNYASFFLMKEKGLKEKILRVTLTQINKSLQEYSNIIRCHKSYIINVKYINDISGNARGYLLKSDIIPLDIPVSRKFSKQALVHLIQ
ncbi:LytTR family transcriptional regulator [Polaribacter pectinis]|uniref:LytTR family transcriptional regulator n=1 Tax=Polaribacter pectinis TaxID=2738844 RepID=A0A7G9L8T8_9FLAO|nr:LytTR family DNA-binding domain-containing protein [Polaribacter pectinis]QNM85037.1 LytTR family transcriptional regulator [Polaribacter pectinis]